MHDSVQRGTRSTVNISLYSIHIVQKLVYLLVFWVDVSSPKVIKDYRGAESPFVEIAEFRSSFICPRCIAMLAYITNPTRMRKILERRHLAVGWRAWMNRCVSTTLASKTIDTDCSDYWSRSVLDFLAGRSVRETTGSVKLPSGTTINSHWRRCCLLWY